MKNKKADILPMHPILVKIIRGFKRKYNISGPPEEFIFDYNRDYLTNTFRRAFARAGLEHIISQVHIIRHAFITNLLRETGDITLTRDMARHSDYNTTKRYLHLLPEDHREKFKHIKMGKNSKKVPKT